MRPERPRRSAAAEFSPIAVPRKASSRSSSAYPAPALIDLEQMVGLVVTPTTVPLTTIRSRSPDCTKEDDRPTVAVHGT
jgi:hypothetical protein